MAGELRDFLASLPQGLARRRYFRRCMGGSRIATAGYRTSFGRLMQRAEIVAPVGREKRGRGRQVRTKSFHSLRHTFVSRLANADVPPTCEKHSPAIDTDEAHARYTHLAFTKQIDAWQSWMQLVDGGKLRR